ncbi:BMA-PAXT-1, isoform a [Elysia marginata]|uniref:BMA-PAXT-1, isoform a n=1 Tax=Elysia marginata TaxID=1093978 RepID=A0AAV4I2I8_9GAST|nr:BMA-PAXT-1, isoform a [Elysia marginata]
MDVDSLRDEFESNTEWRLRRQFLETNIDSLPLDRLICLSRCFINMAVYGCSYPRQVMLEIQERGRGLVEEVEAGKKAQAKQEFSQSFVKRS